MKGKLKLLVRSSISIIGVAIAIALLFAASFLAQASTVNISNFKYERVEGEVVVINGQATRHEIWVFSWDTVADQSDVSFQVTGGGISEVWVGLTNYTTTSVGSKTELKIPDPQAIQSIPIFFA